MELVAHPLGQGMPLLLQRLSKNSWGRGGGEGGVPLVSWSPTPVACGRRDGGGGGAEPKTKTVWTEDGPIDVSLSKLHWFPPQNPSRGWGAGGGGGGPAGLCSCGHQSFQCTFQHVRGPPPPPPLRHTPHAVPAAAPLRQAMGLPPPPPCVTFRRVVAPLRGPGQSPVLPFACCVASLRSVGRCGRCSCWCRFRVRGAQSLVCWGCAECGGMCRLGVSGAQ